MVTDKALVPMAEGSEIKYDVIVIGGGISGLTTAYHLKKRDPKLRIIVLEAKGHCQKLLYIEVLQLDRVF